MKKIEAFPALAFDFAVGLLLARWRDVNVPHTFVLSLRSTTWGAVREKEGE